MPLDTYRDKRDFDQTNEPTGATPTERRQRFVVQEHHATRLHYDFRLELNGVLKSWAVPKGPSLDPTEKRLAVLTEDHPIAYLDFAGHIPEGNYGAGDMVIWDSGTWTLGVGADPQKEFEGGKFKIVLSGSKLRGKFALIKMARAEKEWLLIKEHDEFEVPGWEADRILPWGSNKSKPAETPTLDPSLVPGSRKAAMPSDVSPMLGTLVDEPFSNPDWLFELKWDGFRGLCTVDSGRARLKSRNGIDIGERYPALSALPSKLRCRQAVLDGELVALDKDGKPQFQLLQTALQSRDGRTLVYYAFDILYCDGYDMTRCSLIDRKRFLQKLLVVDNVLRFSDHVEGNGLALYEQAQQIGLEGLMAKRRTSLYDGGRSRDWLKIKILLRVDVVIGGYTEPRGSRKQVGSVLAGAYVDGKLIPIGHVSIGSSEEKIDAIYERLHKLEIDKSPFAGDVRTNDTPHWVEPKLVAEVRFADWTADQQLRHPFLLGFRDDKAADEVVLETPEPTSATLVGAMHGTDVRHATDQGHRTVPGAARSEPANAGGGMLPSPDQHSSADRPSGTGSMKLTATRPADETDRIADVLADPASDNEVTIDIDGWRVKVTNLDKVYWPDDGFKKRDLLSYYMRVAPVMLPQLKDRPLILKRYPNGIAASHFFQHNVEGAPDYVRSYEHPEDDRMVRYAICDNAATLLYLANLGAISMDAWLSRIPPDGKPDKILPDTIVFDLDPDDVPMEGVCEVALMIRDQLRRLGLEGYPKTSGASGMHVYVPIEPLYDFEHVLPFANLVAAQLARRKPNLITIERSVKKRGNKRVYLDCYQNSEGKSVAAAYAVRAVPGAQVSAPLAWKDVENTVALSDYTIRTMPARIATYGDLFAPVATQPMRLSGAIEALYAAATGQ